MEPISKLNKLLEVLRQKRASAQTNKTTGSVKSQTIQKTGPEKIAGQQQARDINKLKSILISRLKALSKDDFKSDKAHTVFIESVSSLYK